MCVNMVVLRFSSYYTEVIKCCKYACQTFSHSRTRIRLDYRGEVVFPKNSAKSPGHFPLLCFFLLSFFIRSKLHLAATMISFKPAKINKEKRVQKRK